MVHLLNKGESAGEGLGLSALSHGHLSPVFGSPVKFQLPSGGRGEETVSSDREFQ